LAASRDGGRRVLSSSLSEAFEVGVKGRERTFPVPIDYYKVLGLGSQRHASREELDRAYASRTAASNQQGIPFSSDAAEGRQRVLELARQALTSRSPSRSRVRMSTAGSQGGIALRPTHESVALPVSWMSGVALLLVEVGDFENCIALGTSLLDQSGSSPVADLFGLVMPASSSSEGVQTPAVQERRARLSRTQRRDVSLAVALSHCELAKVYLDNSPSGPPPSPSKRKQKRRVAEGCAHLNSALELLKSAPGKPRLMPLLCEEIEGTLERLVAPCALDHLRLPLEDHHGATRQQAALVLEELLLEDNIDSSITNSFVQAVLKALTVRETLAFLPWREVDFAAPETPVGVWYDSSMLYKAALAGILSGFLDKEPKLVVRGLELLNKVEEDEVGAGRAVDLAGERAVGMVLLGKLEEAVEILEEAEASVGGSIKELEQMTAGGSGTGSMDLPSSGSMMMTFIRMQGGGLEGITAFAEQYLASKMELFRDTKDVRKMGKRKTLEEYFDDKRVRRYCSAEWGLAQLWDSGVDRAAGALSGTKKTIIQGDRDLSFLGKACIAGLLALAFGASGLVGREDRPARTAVRHQQQVREAPKKVSTGTRARKPEASLTNAEVRWLIKKWNGIKSSALGQQHDIRGLRESLVGDLWTEWKERAISAKRAGCYWKYELVDVNVMDISNVGTSGNVVTAKVRIEEKAELIEKRGGKVRSAYSEPYEVTYTFKTTTEGWKIFKVVI